MNIDNLRQRLTADEGKRLAAYLDSEGILSIGIGHNCEASPVPGIEKVGDTISEELCAEIFESDIAEKVADLDRELPWWRELDDARQNVLLNMCFNMGIRTLLGFHNTLAYMRAGQYDRAAVGMLRSKWADQVGKRAERLASSMETGALA